MMLTIFDAVAISANVPFRTKISGAELRESLANGSLPEQLEPHLERVLAELPIGALAELVFAYPAEQQEKVINNLMEFGHRWGRHHKDRTMADEWLILFDLAMDMIDRAETVMGHKIEWTVGGGTMLHHMFSHRYSKDIDIFLNDPQVLLSLSPRTNLAYPVVTYNHHGYTEKSGVHGFPALELVAVWVSRTGKEASNQN